MSKPGLDLKEPYEYQRVIDREALEALEAGMNVAVEAPTGSGKSGIMTRIGDAWAQKVGGHALILEDGEPIFNRMTGLVRPADAEFGEVEGWTGYEPGYVGGGHFNLAPEGGEPTRVIVGIVDTVRQMIARGEGDKLPDVSIILIDEYHHTYDHPDCEFRRVIDYFEKRAAAAGKKLMVAGASATPWRPENSIAGSGRDRLDRAFNDDVCVRLKIPYMEVVRHGGVLLPQTDVVDIKNGRGQSVESVLHDLAGKKEHLADALENISASLNQIRDQTWWERAVYDAATFSKGRSSIWFMDTMRKGEDGRAEGEQKPLKKSFGQEVEFEKMGDGEKAWALLGELYGIHERNRRCAFITSHSKSKEKDRIYQEFSKGNIEHLISCQMLVEGYDERIAKCAMVFKKLVSSRQQRQLGGRVVRKYADFERGFLRDYGATTLVHGKLEDVYRAEELVYGKLVGAQGANNLLRSMDGVDNGWRMHSTGRQEFYAKNNGSEYLLIVRDLNQDNGQMGDRKPLIQRLDSDGLILEASAAVRDIGFKYGLLSAAPLKAGRFSTMWDEYKDKAWRGAELEAFVNPPTVARKIAQPPKRKGMLIQAQVVDTNLKTELTEARLQVEKLTQDYGSGISKSGQTKLVLRSGMMLLEMTSGNSQTDAAKAKSVRALYEQDANVTNKQLSKALAVLSNGLKPGGPIGKAAAQAGCQNQIMYLQSRLEVLSKLVAKDGAATQQTKGRHTAAVAAVA